MHDIRPTSQERSGAAECDRLLALADAMPAVADRRRAIAGEWYRDVLALTQTPGLETPRGERALDDLAAQLRRAWMATAHEFADVTFRSPPASGRKTLPSRTVLAYGYERSIEDNPLEPRLAAYRPVPEGWHAAHFLFSSGMAALSAAMQTLPALLAERAQPHALLAAAAYYETLGLFDLGSHRCADVRVTADDASFLAAAHEHAPHVAFVEPIIYDPDLRPFDVAAAARALAALPLAPGLIVDSTLVGPTIPFPRILDACRSLPFVLHASSGLKLDQAGLELANVGILSLYVPERRAPSLDAIAQHVRDVRRLNGTALTIDTIALLDVPFFLDPALFVEYTSAVFAHNARLAHGVPTDGLFEAVAHPALRRPDLPWARTPFVFFHLRDDDVAAYEALEALVLDIANERGLALDRGGSFGFRSHRCEAVALERSTRNGVFKVALGARSGPSVDGIIDVLATAARFPDVAAARAALAPARHYDAPRLA